MSRAGQRTTFYNPSLLRREELRATFLARQPLLEELLAHLRAGHRHHLLAGSRGAGKTTLLLRLALALEEDEALRTRFIPLRFPEEQYNLAQLSDLWVNALSALAETLEDAAAVNEIERALTSLHDLREEERQQRGLQTLLQWAERAAKVLVLLVDNLDLALARLAAHHWQLHESFAREPRLALIGATSAALDETREGEAAFYELFTIHQLTDLDEREARQLLRQLGSPRVHEILDGDPARLRSLFSVCGVTPRTVLLLLDLLEQGRSTSAREDLEALLDHLTPYYKARFDSLSPQSQLLVHAVAMHGSPITAAECDRQTRIGLNATSAVLHRLTMQGILAKRASTHSSKLSFHLHEHLFQLWYLMRTGRGRQRHQLSSLAGF